MLAIFLVLLALVGCDGSVAQPSIEKSASTSDELAAEREREENRLYVDPATIDFRRNPDLLVRLRTSLHNYFRFIHARFASEVCAHFGEEGTSTLVNLHGDAHLEQYAVTDIGRGLTDFDGATVGPLAIDLVRMGVSIRLASQQRGHADRAGPLTDALLEAYRVGVGAQMETLPPEPAWARRTRAAFTSDREAMLDRNERLAHPLSDAQTEEARSVMLPYAAAQRADNPALDERFFEVLSVGQIDLGIGSAMNEKYLLRIRGPSSDPSDDEIIEAKEVQDLSGISCFASSISADPFRILLGESRIAFAPFPYLGFVHAADKVFWVHGWTSNYQELSVSSLEATDEELEEVIRDLGIQLGHGHVDRIAAPLDAHFRRATLQYLDAHTSEIIAAIETLTSELDTAWGYFLEDTNQHPALDGLRSPGPTVFRPDQDL